MRVAWQTWSGRLEIVLACQSCAADQHILFMQVTKEELVANLRLQSRSFQRQSSKFRGVTRHQKGKWEARVGLTDGKKYK